jgi:hypothetical protein
VEFNQLSDTNVAVPGRSRLSTHGVQGASTSSVISVTDAPNSTIAAKLRLYRLSSTTEALLLLPLAKLAHAEGVQRSLPFSERKFLNLVTAALARGASGACFYSSFGQQVVGVINLAIGEAWLGEGGCFATCLQWFVAPPVRSSLLGGRVALQLLSAAKRWARASGGSHLFIHGTHGLSGGALSHIGRSIGTNVIIALNDLPADLRDPFNKVREGVV